ncbi:Zn-dependent protease with chaperone function [Agromyces cerinus]|uniref:M56 family metallopeptidase n=1 Tax=Agromyces cerinus TaxID=33878 RepID=UPI00195E58FE|nr:M56 family metallopeptidase [Agromyces cerinus]MBM7830750.1 Zn-dependent protease with chaperone function [Agromyces cerinus]
MLAVAVLLGGFALLLAWPIPLVLSRASWPNRSPAIALALWQAIALGGGLSMIGCLLVFGASPAGSLLGAAQALLPLLFTGPIPPEFGVVHLAALTLAAGLALHLALNLALTAVRAERERRRQHQLIDLLSDPMPGQPRTRVLAHPVPLAYCVPGIRSATVLTDGLIDALDEAELRAVIAHERAHLDQLHHLVLLAFRAWHSALPWFPIANRAERSVALLAEMLADDHARRESDDEALRRAMLQVGSGGEPGAYADSGGVVPDVTMLEARLARLDEPQQLSGPLTGSAVVWTAAIIVAVPIVALLATLGALA